jgi:hypothetical protein
MKQYWGVSNFSQQARSLSCLSVSSLLPNPFSTRLHCFNKLCNLTNMQLMKKRECACWIKKNKAEIKKRTEKHTCGCELRMKRCRDQELRIDAQSRIANRCLIKNYEFKKRQRIKKRESERRRFMKRNKSLTLFADLKQWSRVFCSSALRDWNCFFFNYVFSLSTILHRSSSSV